jgi:hypothetical protein
LIEKGTGDAGRGGVAPPVGEVLCFYLAKNLPDWIEKYLRCIPALPAIICGGFYLELFLILVVEYQLLFQSCKINFTLVVYLRRSHCLGNSFRNIAKESGSLFFA